LRDVQLVIEANQESIKKAVIKEKLNAEKYIRLEDKIQNQNNTRPAQPTSNIDISKP